MPVVGVFRFFQADVFQSLPKACNVLFGGDSNRRDSEACFSSNEFTGHSQDVQSFLCTIELAILHVCTLGHDPNIFYIFYK